MSNIKGKRYEVIDAWRGHGDFDDLFENGDIVGVIGVVGGFLIRFIIFRRISSIMN